MIKTPITDSVSTSITATLTASPLENESATGGDEKELVKPISYVYSLLIMPLPSFKSYE